MAELFRAIKRVLLRDEGASFAEYGVMLLLIAAITIAGIALLGNALSSFFVSAAGSI
jgi:Flp pilus assembly pilin Flp